MSILEFGHRADVADVELGNLGAVLPLSNRQVVELLGRTARGVVHLRAVAQATCIDAEERHITDVRLGHGLEDLRHHRVFVSR